jgi:hypothetical protein
VAALAIFPVAGIILSALLIFEIGGAAILFGLKIISLGVPIFAFYSPRSERELLKATFYSTEAIVARVTRTQRVFVGYLLRIALRRH